MANYTYRCEVEKRLAESWPWREWGDFHIVLAVSGGPDSVALMRAMTSLKEAFGGSGQLYVAHLNHGLRAAANDDEAWLKSLCERPRIPLEVGRADIGAIATGQGDGWEAAARSARYEFLRQTAERLGARFVVTGHTADDQAETVLHRIVRGTGIAGLAGMPKVRPLSASVALIRPLLGVRRSEVIEYLAAIGQDYRTDASNEDVNWTRNRLRHELLPELRARFNPKVDDVLLRLAAQAGEAQQLIGMMAADLARECVKIETSRARIDCGKLAGQPPIVAREVCKIAWGQAGWPEQAMGFDQWQQLASLKAKAPLPCPLRKGEDKQEVVNLPGNIRAFCDGPFLIVEQVVR